MTYREEIRERAKVAREQIREQLPELLARAGIPQLDDRDREIIARRVEQYNMHTGPQEGDFVDFADGVSRRISHVWRDDGDSEWGGPQTSDGGSFYLGEGGYMSFSGSLFGRVPFNSLTLAEETRPGKVWIFHHDHWTAHNSVDAKIPCRVYSCSLPAPS